MKAIILAGGEGQRLRPLTKTRPKPLMRVADRTILDILLERLSLFGVKEAGITLGYRGEDIKVDIGDERHGVRVTYFEEKNPLGTAGSVKNCEGFLEGDTLILSGDALTDVDFSAVEREHKKKKANITLVLTKRRNPSAYGVVELDGEGRVTRFLEKPPLPEDSEALVNCGIYIIKKEVLQKVPKGEFFDFAKDLFPITEGLYGYETSDFWCDIGSFSEYRRSNLLTLSEGFFLHHSTEENPSVVKSVVGEHSRILDGVRISDSVVGRHARIGRGSRLYDCILGDGVTVGEGVTIGKDTVIGDFAVIGDGAVLTKGERIEPYSAKL